MHPKEFTNTLPLIVTAILVGAGVWYVSMGHNPPPILSANPTSSITPVPASAPISTPGKTTPGPEYSVVLVPRSPLGNNPRGTGLLDDDECLTSSDVDMYKWGIQEASREFLMKKGYSEAYFGEHFCAIAITYNGLEEKGYARVIYKATFQPYLTWWQHHFPVVIDADGQPKLENGTAIVDSSGKHFLIPEFDIAEFRTWLLPKELYTTMQNLIGAFDGPIVIGIGLGMGKNDVRLYGRATNKNPNSDNCSSTERVGTIDVATGKGEITFSGACR